MEETEILDETEIINEKDNLGLSTFKIDSIPTPDIIFPNELNAYLQGQIQFLLHSKGLLEIKISDTELELKDKNKLITKLNKKIAEYEQFTKPIDGIVSGNPVHLMSAKIVELSKRLKEKNVETESLKTKFSKMQLKLIQLEKGFTTSYVDTTDNFTSNDSKEALPKLNYQEEIKSLQEKLSLTTNRLFEVKNKNIELKNELKTATRLLQQELGEAFTSIQNYSTQSNWRGRAQQIIHLQQKNSELQEKVALLSLNTPSLQVSKPDQRKALIDQLEKDITNLKTELEETKKKLSIAKTRIKVLENEAISSKMKMNSILSKNDSDEKIIRSLKNQITSLEDTHIEIEKEKQTTIKKLEEQIKNLKLEVERDNFVIDNLQKNIEDKNNKIKDLQTENLTSTKRNNSGSLSDRVASPCKQDQNKLQILEVERKRLLELVEVLNGRLKEEREANSNIQINYKKERQKAARLETKLSRIELENCLNSSYANSYAKSMCKLNSPQSNADLGSNISYENLKNNLELAEEHINLLKSKLELVQKEKDIDLQKFSQILTETSSMLVKYNPEEISNVSAII